MPLLCLSVVLAAMSILAGNELPRRHGACGFLMILMLPNASRQKPRFFAGTVLDSDELLGLPVVGFLALRQVTRSSWVNHGQCDVVMFLFCWSSGHGAMSHFSTLGDWFRERIRNLPSLVEAGLSDLF